MGEAMLTPKVVHGFTHVNGLRYHYLEAGRGPLVVLLHGFPESSGAWRHQIQPLVNAGFRVVAPDQRGYNETDKRGPFDLDVLASDVRELIQALGEERAHVVGHGWGGAVAWHLAATRPYCVDRLVILGCPHPARLAEVLRSNRRQQLKALPFLFLQLPIIPEQVLKLFARPVLSQLYWRSARGRMRVAAEELRPLVEAVRRPGAAKSMIDWHRAAFRKAMRNRFRVPEYPEIAQETLLLWGKDDRSLSFEQLVPGTERHAPQLHVEVLEGCGHFMHVEKPEQVSKLLTEFLAVPASAADSPLRREWRSRNLGRAAGPSRASRSGAFAAPPEKTVAVVLANAGENKISVIKEIRMITGLGIKDARELVEGAPKTIIAQTTREDAERISHLLTTVGASVEIT
jgi:epoxide hydrolase 4